MADRRSLYVSRRVTNADELIAWAKGQGFATTLPPEDLHVTVAFSRAAVDWDGLTDSFDELTLQGGPRTVEPLGDKGAVVLRFESAELHMRWQEFVVTHGASWDHDGYHPHITLTYAPGDVDLGAVEPYRGRIVLGPEQFELVDEDWSDKVTEKVRIRAEITKRDDEQRIVWGWASVVAEKGALVVDSQDDILPPDVLAKAVYDFVADVRVGKVMHAGDQQTELVESIMFTEDMQKALGIDLGKVGWFAGWRVRDETLWEAVKRGDYPAFSIGGAAKSTTV